MYTSLIIHVQRCPTLWSPRYYDHSYVPQTNWKSSYFLTITASLIWPPCYYGLIFTARRCHINGVLLYWEVHVYWFIANILNNKLTLQILRHIARLNDLCKLLTINTCIVLLLQLNLTWLSVDCFNLFFFFLRWLHWRGENKGGYCRKSGLFKGCTFLSASGRGTLGHMDIFLNNTKLLCLYSGGMVV